MNKFILIFSSIVLALASCKKNEVAPALKTPAIDSITKALKDTAVAVAQTKMSPSASAKGGPGSGSGGGGTTVPPTNLDIYTKQLIGSWLTVVGIPGTTGTIFMTATYKADNTFTLVAVNNVTGGRTNFSGNWQFTIPANTPINESGLLVMTSGSITLMSGFLYFVHPGITEYQTPVNNLNSSLKAKEYVFQKT